MTLEEYQNVIKQYDELLTASMGIHKQYERAIEAKMDFISHAFVNPAYTMKASWFVEQDKMIVLDRIIQMHPFDFCTTYANQSKDWDKALDMLQKYLHEKIDRMF